ncbi:MAG: oligopeptide transporter periplasmic oligopeptide-binding protein OppA [Acidimicrobiaceae bacterium]|nr:oligopeptide transporter periplasmic oligopeptide-binding protein OppA [Acidimicrobiaceae bacterium]
MSNFKARSATAGAAALTALGLLVGTLGTGTSGASVRSSSSGGSPVKGGTLTLAGQGDIDFMYPPAGYNTTTHTEERAWTRQLFTYPASTNTTQLDTPAADVAAVIPTVANGGITAGGAVYTIHIRPGVMWNTTPARAVTAGDFVRAFKLLCNPVAPVGAPGYFTSSIQGMASYCKAEAQITGTVSGIASYVNTHNISGVQATNSSTLVFHLVHPTSDFLDIIAEPFASAVPVEYLQYLPNSAAFDAHTLSDGPYEIQQYTPGSRIVLVRNPVWKPSTDPIRKAYVNKIVIEEGMTPEAVQQAIQTGAADMEWDITPPTPDLPGLAGNPHLTVNSSGEVTYLVVNLQSPSVHGALKNLKVRQALQYAIDKTALSQVLGGSKIATPANQMLTPIDIGFKDFNLYPTPNNSGDPTKAKKLLATAGYPHGLTLKLAYSNTGETPQLAASIQNSLAKAGFKIQLEPATQTNFNDKYVGNPAGARTGLWDLAIDMWVPDWFGNNGRSVLEPMTDGPGYGPQTVDYADYNSPKVNSLVAQALSLPAADQAQVSQLWHEISMQTAIDTPYVPLVSVNVPLFTSTRVMNAVYLPINENFDITNIWLKGDA